MTAATKAARGARDLADVLRLLADLADRPDRDDGHGVATAQLRVLLCWCAAEAEGIAEVAEKAAAA